MRLSPSLAGCRLFPPGLVLLGVLALPALVVAGPKPPEPPPLEVPKPPPAQVSSSEGTLPFPLPLTPQKRQEKKNPPVPPVLLTKIRTADAEDWTRTPNDLKGLLEWMSAELKVNFSSNVKAFGEISPDPTKNPVLYRSGYKAFRLNGQETAILRQYVLNGGTVIFNALVGNPDFYASALEASRQILPESQTYRLRMDHPAFHSFYDIGKVAYRDRMVRDGVVGDPFPWIDGADIDNRTAIFVSRWDFSLGWAQSPHESWGYADTDARKLGANIVSYATAMRDSGRSVGKSVQLANAAGASAGKFRVAQIKHDGVWKTRAAAFPMLLSQFNAATGAPVSFDLRDVSLGDASIFDTPFLYLTGSTDFSFTEPERANLRRFLQNGGVLFAEASEGRPSFDAAFRAEMARVLPGAPLAALPAQHELFQQPMKAAPVRARPALAARLGNRSEVDPELDGISLNGTLAVIYAPYDLSAGWERAVAPYAVGYEPAGATALGLNVLYYAVTH